MQSLYNTVTLNLILCPFSFFFFFKMYYCISLNIKKEIYQLLKLLSSLEIRHVVSNMFFFFDNFIVFIYFIF